MSKKKSTNKYRTPILIVVGIVLFFLGMFQLNQSTMSSAALTVDTTMVDLGEIPIQGGIVEARYTLQNNGNEPITVTQGETSCMCTEAAIQTENGEVSKRIKMPGHGASTASLDIVIAPKETATLIAYYDPMAHGPSGTGPIKRDVTLQTNSSAAPSLSVSFQGVVIP